MEGKVLAGRYRLERHLGQGAMGSVWLAQHLALGSPVAVKLLDPEIARSADGVDRFRREAQAAASLRSAHVVQVLDYGVDETTPYLVMELLRGESLGDRLERVKKLSTTQTLSILTQIGRAMSRAHAAGIVHRDLKPDNVFITDEGDHELVKVLDFGIAKTAQHAFGGLETRTGVTMGTPFYMSPEQMEGKRTLDHRTDLWALGVMASECLTGERPFDGHTFGEVLLNICVRPIPSPSSRGPVPAGFDTWFQKATEREPEKRFGSAQEMILALKDVVEGRASDVLATAQRTLPLEGNSPIQNTLPMGAGPIAQTLPLERSFSPSIQHAELEVSPAAAPKRFWIPAVAGTLAVFGALGYFVLSSSPETEPAGTPLFASSGTTRTIGANDVDGIGSAATSSAPALAAETARTPRRARAAPGLGQSTAPRPAPSALPAPSNVASAIASSEPAPSGTLGLAQSNLPRPATLRCYTDPFTGTLRLERAADRARDVATFPCKQDPFTGAYSRAP